MTKMPAEDRPALIQRVIAQIRASVPDLQAIYRFGTWGTAAERMDSDLDIAVLAGTALDAMKRFDLAAELARIVGRDVDVADLRSASSVFRAQVISTGERLFATDERASGIFEDFVYADYARLNEERKYILRDIRDRGSVYGG